LLSIHAIASLSQRLAELYLLPKKVSIQYRI
jgi:hypothetical protein